MKLLHAFSETSDVSVGYDDAKKIYSIMTRIPEGLHSATRRTLEGLVDFLNILSQTKKVPSEILDITYWK